MGNVTQKSQQEMYPRLAGEDRISFNQIERSEFIRQAVRDKIFIAHSCPTTIKSISKVCEYFHSAKVSATEELKKLKSNKNRMVLTFDEWTRENIRYLNVDVHTY